MENVIKKAHEEYMRGGHCSEVIFKYVTAARSADFDQNLARIANPFGGGMADCGDTCGALIGGLMVIGYIYGRRNLSEDQTLSWQLSRAYHEGFRQEFGDTTCYGIRGKVFNRETHIRCSRTVRRSIQLLWRILDSAEVENSE